VREVARSIEFYCKLGFSLRSKLESEGRMVWAWVENGHAHLMLTRADEALVPETRDVTPYLYCRNITAYRDELIAKGIKVGEIEYPPYMPEGEFGIEDPDGYCLLVGQTDEVSL
jgi:predicted lactoylglutathione lyase